MEEAAFEQHEVEEAANMIQRKQTDPILTEVFGKYHLEEVYDIR